MDFQTAVKTCFSKYVTFEGRASRSEFWWFVLFTVIGQIVLSFVEAVLLGGGGTVALLSGAFGLATFLPSISVAVRRLHDLDKSGWWWWIVLIPLIGWIILIVWDATIGTSGSNTYGPDPLDDDGRNDDGGQDYGRSSIPSVQRKD